MFRGFVLLLYQVGYLQDATLFFYNTSKGPASSSTFTSTIPHWAAEKFNSRDHDSKNSEVAAGLFVRLCTAPPALERRHLRHCEDTWQLQSAASGIQLKSGFTRGDLTSDIGEFTRGSSKLRFGVLDRR